MAVGEGARTVRRLYAAALVPTGGAAVTGLAVVVGVFVAGWPALVEVMATHRRVRAYEDPAVGYIDEPASRMEVVGNVTLPISVVLACALLGVMWNCCVRSLPARPPWREAVRPVGAAFRVQLLVWCAPAGLGAVLLLLATSWVGQRPDRLEDLTLGLIAVLFAASLVCLSFAPVAVARGDAHTAREAVRRSFRLVRRGPVRATLHTALAATAAALVLSVADRPTDLATVPLWHAAEAVTGNMYVGYLAQLSTALLLGMLVAFFLVVPAVVFSTDRLYARLAARLPSDGGDARPAGAERESAAGPGGA